MILLLAFAISLFYLSREVLVLTGVLKAPVLRACEAYGDATETYTVLPRLFFWAGATLLLGGIIAAAVINSLLGVTGTVGLALLIAAYILVELPTTAARLVNLPRWYYDLLERTGHLERRKIAFMWRRLPRKTRMLYNSNNKAFQQWADQVILSTRF